MQPIHRLLIALFLVLPFYSAAQDTLYLNANWKPTSKIDAAYYRLIWPKENGRYKVEDHFLDGKLQMLGFYLLPDPENKKARNGLFQYYTYQGNIKSEEEYVAGNPIGTWKYYFSNSTVIKEQTQYKPDSIAYNTWYDSISHNKLGEMTWKGNCPIDTDRYYYKSNGGIMKEIVYANCKKLLEKYYNKDGTLERSEPYDNSTHERDNHESVAKEIHSSKTIFTYVEQMPVPTVDLSMYLRENITYPYLARRDNIEGRVITKFVVNEDGTVSNVQVVKGIGAGCDEEAVRVISGMPNWKAGKQNGEPVKVNFTLPVVFKLEKR